MEFCFLTFILIATLTFITTEAAKQPIQHNIAQVREKPAKHTKSPGVRNYYAPLTEQEKADIRYLITTLANKSTISLFLYKRSLNQAGERTGHIHPLKFFLFVFTDEQMKRSIKKNWGMPWRRFVEGMGESFSNASKRDNMKEEYIEDFVKKVGIRKSLIYSSIKNRRWKKFITEETKT